MANIAHAKSVTVADWSGVVTVGNSTGGTTTAQASNLARPSDWNSQHNFTLSASDVGSFFAADNGLTASTNTNGVTYGINSVQYFEPFPFNNSTTRAITNGSWYIDPFLAPAGLPKGQLAFARNNALPWFGNNNLTASLTGSGTRYQTVDHLVAIYSRGTSDSSTALYTQWTGKAGTTGTQEGRITTSNTAAGTTSMTISHYGTISMITSINATGGESYGTYTGSGTVTTAMTTSAVAVILSSIGVSTLNLYCGTGSFFNGPGLSSQIPPGNYYIAWAATSATSTAGTNAAGIVNVAFSYGSAQGISENNFRAFLGLNASVSNSSTSPEIWHGFIATTSTAAFSKIATSDVRQLTNAMRRFWNVSNG